MAFLSQRKLLGIIDDDRVKAAIADAEKRTSGEIRVSVSRFFYGSARRAAERAFGRMKMRDTRDRNGILFFIVPSRRRFVVVGDEGIHARVGQEFWDGLVAAMADDFRQAKFNEGLIRGIAECGRLLAEHFPYQGARDVNELPDDIDYGNKE
jgi:uncharacterized membrane protein